MAWNELGLFALNLVAMVILPAPGTMPALLAALYVLILSSCSVKGQARLWHCEKRLSEEKLPYIYAF